MQVEASTHSGGFDALGIRCCLLFRAHPPPLPAVQRQRGKKNHFICEMISYEINCIDETARTYLMTIFHMKSKMRVKNARVGEYFHMKCAQNK